MENGDRCHLFHSSMTSAMRRTRRLDIITLGTASCHYQGCFVGQGCYSNVIGASLNVKLLRLIESGLLDRYRKGHVRSHLALLKC